MICSRCASANSAGAAHCLRCGAALPIPTTESEAVSSPRGGGARLRVILPCVLVAVVLLAGAYARWRMARAPQDTPTQPDSEAAAAQEQQRINDALERVPLANARANDLLRAGDFKGALKLVDEILEITDAPDLRETKVNVLIKAKRYSEAYELLVPLLKDRDLPHLQFLAGQLAQSVKGAGEAMFHFSEAIRQAPQNKVYQLAWANASFKAGARDTSVAMFNKLVAADPQCVACWNDYAVAYYSAAEREQAIAVWQQAVSRCPEKRPGSTANPWN